MDGRTLVDTIYSGISSTTLSLDVACPSAHVHQSSPATVRDEEKTREGRSLVEEMGGGRVLSGPPSSPGGPVQFL